MKIQQFGLWAIILLCATPFTASAATHDVSIVGLTFQPNDLTIAVGDTVRWTNNGGTHDVREDNGAWSSAISFVTYERTFDSVAEILYHCSVHSAPGRNINSSMNGRINVVEPAAADFLINTGLSDAWYDPLTSGQGFFIIVWEESQVMFLSWFTYDTERPPENVTAMLGEPGHRWLTAQGTYSVDTAMLDVYLSSGGEFDAAEPAVPPPEKVGTITIVWTGCNEGLLSYDLDLPGLSGDIAIERIVLDNVPACEAAQPQ